MFLYVYMKTFFFKCILNLNYWSSGGIRLGQIVKYNINYIQINFLMGFKYVVIEYHLNFGYRE